jgi:hypothetical protein
MPSLFLLLLCLFIASVSLNLISWHALLLYLFWFQVYPF